MKKEKMITRTITTTLVTFDAIDLETYKVVRRNDCPLTGKFENLTDIENALHPYLAESEKVIKIVETTESEDLYAIPESTFLRYAEKVAQKYKEV